MLAAFRAISISEGLSYLTILSVTLGWVSREFVYLIGMTHGVLFMLYLAASLLVANQRGWSLLTWLGLLAAAVVPFAFIAVELVLRRALHQGAPAPEAAA